MWSWFIFRMARLICLGPEQWVLCSTPHSANQVWDRRAETVKSQRNGCASQHCTAWFLSHPTLHHRPTILTMCFSNRKHFQIVGIAFKRRSSHMRYLNAYDGCSNQTNKWFCICLYHRFHLRSELLSQSAAFGIRIVWALVRSLEELQKVLLIPDLYFNLVFLSLYPTGRAKMHLCVSTVHRGHSSQPRCAGSVEGS